MGLRQKPHHRLGFGLIGTQHRNTQGLFVIAVLCQALSHHRAERPGRAKLKEPGHPHTGQKPDPVHEPHRLAGMTHPIPPRTQLLAGGHPAGEVGNHRKLRLPEGHVLKDRAELLQHRLHPRGMESVTHLQPGGFAAPLLPHPDPLLNSVGITGDHNRPRSVDPCHTKTAFVTR
ncbi:hypothetical protein MSIMFI_05517 [Mycobacterium simulans]|nr:hypothetical protein MSIMFI_05517 [Mycobacterium simulans]